MPLLSRDERKSLTGPERRELRRERRVERRLQERQRRRKNREHPRPRLRLNWSGVRAFAEEQMRDIAGDAIPGADKMEEVLDDVLDWLDNTVLEFDDVAGDGLVGSFVEVALEGITDAGLALLRAMLRAHLQRWYDELA